MLKPLRHPTVFALLSICLAGWLHALSLFYDPDLSAPGRSRYLPVEWALDQLPNRERVVRLPTFVPSGRISPQTLSAAGINVLSTTHPDPPIKPVLVFESESGIRAIRDVDDAEIPPLPPDRAASFVVGSYHKPDSFGLVLPCVRLQAVEYDVVNSGFGSAPLDKDIVLRTAGREGFLPLMRQWDVRWQFVAHDALFAAILLAWLYALLTIPAWKLWRNLTPAQRRRNHHACPSCGYDRSAAPNTPCPECGSATAIK